MVCGTGRTRLLGLGARCGQLRLRALLSGPLSPASASASRCLSGPPPPASSRRRLPLVATSPVARVAAVTALPGPSPWLPSRSMASGPEKQSLAEGVLKAKEAEAEEARRRTTEGEENKEGGEDKKGYKPLSKWQRRGYLFFAVTMVGGLVSNAVLFGENLN